jgi:CelD/BcsL family acetyltransferase involved in cellulose biosynthesis
VGSLEAEKSQPPSRVAHAKQFGQPVGRAFRILQTDLELMSIKAEWDRLWAESEAEYFLCHSAIVESWNTIHRPQGAKLCCAVVMDQERLVGVLPMILNRRWAWTVASTCTPHASECCDMIIKRQTGSSELATALLRKAIEIVRPDSMYFDYVPSGNHLDSAIRAIPWLRIDETWAGTAPIAVLHAETDWTAYMKSLGKRYQANVARANRRLSEQGTVTFEVLQQTPRSLIDWLFEHKQKWSDRTEKRGQWVFSEFYKDYLSALWSSEPRYLTFALKLDGALIALKLMAINTTTASLVVITYDEKYRRFSPGNILDERMFKYLFDNYRTADGKFFDVLFGTGVENFKAHWGRDHVVPVTSFRMAISRVGAAAIRIKEILRDAQRSLSRAPKPQ